MPPTRKPVAASIAHLIAGQLPEDELGIGQVVVERGDHPIAIRPGVGPRRCSFRSRCFRQTERRRASAGPSVRRSGARPAAGRPVSRRRRAKCPPQTRVDLLGRRRQAEQVERRAANERGAVGLGRRLQAAASSRASTKASIGVRTQSACSTAGIAGRRASSSDHQSRPAAGVGCEFKGTQHAVRRARWRRLRSRLRGARDRRPERAVPLPSGGISPARSRSTRWLSSGLPGTMAGCARFRRLQARWPGASDRDRRRVRWRYGRPGNGGPAAVRRGARKSDFAAPARAASHSITSVASPTHNSLESSPRPARTREASLITINRGAAAVNAHDRSGRGTSRHRPTIVQANRSRSPIAGRIGAWAGDCGITCETCREGAASFDD